MSKMFGCGLFLFTCCLPMVAQDFCQWGNAPIYFARHKVQLELNGNVRIEGSWVGVNDQSAEFVVSKSSDHNRYPKGPAIVPRSTIRSAAYRGHASLGRVFGLLGGLMLGGATVFSVPRAVALPVYLGAIVGGFYAGREVDRRWHAVTILP